MEKFYVLETEEEFKEFMDKQHEDDKDLKIKFAVFDHRKFNFSLINIGIMLDIVRTYFKIEKDKLNDTLKLDKDKIKTRRINKMVSELNEKINLRYELDEETMIVPYIFIYQDEAYLMINKCLFVDSIINRI